VAKKYDLGCLEKRDLLNETAVSVETLRSWGEHYEEVGSLYDALDFYERVGAKEALSRLLERAEAAGNVFLFRRLCRLLERTPEPEAWLALARRAEELGKLSFAAEAYRLGGVLGSSEQTAHDSGK
jgi:hypothetical protein